MNASKRYECQECFRLHVKEEDALSCHPPQLVYICGGCSTPYYDPDIAKHCCSYGVGPPQFDFEGIRKIRLDDE